MGIVLFPPCSRLPFGCQLDRIGLYPNENMELPATKAYPSQYRVLIGFISFLLIAHLVQIFLMGAPDIRPGSDISLHPDTTPFPFWIYAGTLAAAAFGTA